MDDENDFFPLSPILDEYDEYMEMREDQIRDMEAWLERTRVQGIRDTHFIHDVGKYATPSSNTWQAYSATIRLCGLNFDPKEYVFDQAVAESSGNRAIADPSARHYKDYEPLRHNLAVLRNFVLSHVYGEEVDHEEARDKQKYSYVVQIGDEIGDMLRRGNNPLFSNPFAQRVSPKDANVVYDGAAQIYEKLLKVQNVNSWMAPIDFLVHLDKKPYLDQRWKLPPIELTPFGRLNYFAPPPADTRMATADTLVMKQAAHEAKMMQSELANALAMDAIGTGFTSTAIGYNSVESLAQPIKAQAIEIARDILEKLKIRFQSTPVMAMLDYASGSHTPNTITDLNSVIAVYKDHLQRALLLDPSLAEDPMVLGANDAVGFLGTQIKLRALDRAEMLGDVGHADVIRNELLHLPQHWLNPNSFTSLEALSALEQGMEMVVATLQLTLEGIKDQNQREILLDAPQLSGGEDQYQRFQSLMINENVQKMATERYHSFLKQAGGGQGHASTHQNATLAHAGMTAGKKHTLGQTTAASTGGSVFDTMLSNSGANLQQMQGSVNAPTSGNFAAGTPGSVQQVIQQSIAHRSQTGLRPAKAQKVELQRTKREHRKEVMAQKQQIQEQRADKLEAEQEKNVPPPPSRNRSQIER